MTENSQDASSINSNEISNLPKDAQTFVNILKELGVTEYEPKVINQLLEFSYRYITETLDDAKAFATHAGRTNITLEDTKLAIHSQLDHSYTSPPPRDFLVDVARQKNSTPLPSLKSYSGPRLPADRYCLSSFNYRLKESSEIKPSVMKLDRDSISKGTLGSNASQHQFVNPQIIMPTSNSIKRKWQDDDDYD